jgi:hypothetical protein
MNRDGEHNAPGGVLFLPFEDATREAMNPTTRANPTRMADGISSASIPLPRTSTSSMPSFMCRNGKIFDTVCSHAGA